LSEEALKQAIRHSSNITQQQLCQAFAAFISGLFLIQNKRGKAKSAPVRQSLQLRRS